MDIHAVSIVVVRMMHGAKPQPPQTFKPADFLAWVRAELVMQPLGDGSGGLTQGASASPEAWRFDSGLDYETPFGVIERTRATATVARARNRVMA